MRRKRYFWESFTAGAIAGLIGAILVTELAWSLVGVGIVGAIVGIIISWIFNYFRR